MWQRIIRVARFLNKKVVYFMGAGVLVGLMMLVAEFSFAYALQSFLVNLHIVDASALNLPKWFPQLNLVSVLILIFALGTFRAVCQGLQVFTQALTTINFCKIKRREILDWIFASESMPLSEVTRLFHDRCVSSGEGIAKIQLILLQGIVTTFLGVAVFAMAPLPTLVAVIALAITILPLRFLDRRIAFLGKQMAVEADVVSARLIKNVKNFILMRIYGTQNREKLELIERVNNLYSNTTQAWAISGIKNIAPQVAGISAICLISLVSVKYGTMAPGLLLTYFYLFVRFVQYFSLFLQAVSSTLMHIPHLEDMYQWWLKARPNERFSQVVLKEDSNLKVEKKEGIGWNVSNVTFSYDPLHPILKNVSFEVTPGSVMVIRGPSGRGKSTLLALALGLLKPSGGNISVQIGSDSRPIEQLGLSFRNLMGYVGPDPFIINGTVRENLLYGQKTPRSDQDIQDALKMAECDFVNQLPSGLDHSLNDQGEGLSAGQKQRLALARALLRNPKVLVLDEATSNLDSGTESKLVDTFGTMKGKITILAVTHRERLLDIADNILEL